MIGENVAKTHRICFVEIKDSFRKDIHWRTPRYIVVFVWWLQGDCVIYLAWKSASYKRIFVYMDR